MSCVFERSCNELCLRRVVMSCVFEMKCVLR